MELTEGEKREYIIQFREEFGCSMMDARYKLYEFDFDYDLAAQDAKINGTKRAGVLYD